MDRIIILIIVYLIACYIWKKIDCSRHRKIHNAVLFISSIMVIIGCITPLNSTYIILCAIILILLDCLIFVQRNKNYSGFARDATHKPATHHLNGQIISIVLCNQQRLTPFYIKLRPYLLKIY